ncbi:hypothetical protein HF086_005022 [Spodoptera exigua]|uniref:Uncharacterized protein n=1 Tax=Spodoptera exigua TaxID=7107 RepID=A0A922SIG8_SPOEX|nr:hypothetical protein HF086_005022 [Spodoptera exigua]
MFFHLHIAFSLCISLAFSYNNRLYTLISVENISDSRCGIYHPSLQEIKRLKVTKDPKEVDQNLTGGFSFVPISITEPSFTDPLIEFKKTFDKILYGAKAGFMEVEGPPISETDKDLGHRDNLAHWSTGQVMRSETFQGKSGVHMPFQEYLHKGHCRLKITKDYMQTAVDAFAIFISGSLTDVENLPSTYVLDSARTIAMMTVEREKLAATWYVVKGSTPTVNITYETLEKFRPLFKYVNAREIARLNLSDDRILSYVGTHPDLSRHQALGTSYSWSAREVSRLGLLLAEVSGSDLSAINPEAMSGITSQVMLEMPINSLLSVTERQLRYLDPKAHNILMRKLISYQEHLENCAFEGNSLLYINCISILVIKINIVHFY